MQIAIKNLPYSATNLLPFLKICLTLDKLFLIASSLGLYNLLIISYNTLKVLSLRQLKILSHILKSSYMPPME